MTDRIDEMVAEIRAKAPEGTGEDRMTEIAMKLFPTDPVANIVAALAQIKQEDQVESDELDAILFRFWVRAASEFPSTTASAIMSCKTPKEYRAALMKLAKERRINLPGAA